MPSHPPGVRGQGLAGSDRSELHGRIRADATGVASGGFQARERAQQQLRMPGIEHMAAQPHGYAGLDYLAKATTFLIACRLQDPHGGLWDAADIQWWWREDDFRDPAHRLFFETPDGTPRAMLLLLPTYGTFDYGLVPGEEGADLGQQVIATGMAWLEEQRSPTSRPDFLLRSDHHALRRLAEAHGYRAAPDALVRTRQALSSTLERATLPDGYAVRPVQHGDIIDSRQPVLATPPTGAAASPEPCSRTHCKAWAGKGQPSPGSATPARTCRSQPSTAPSASAPTPDSSATHDDEGNDTLHPEGLLWTSLTSGGAAGIRTDPHATEAASGETATLGQPE